MCRLTLFRRAITLRINSAFDHTRAYTDSFALSVIRIASRCVGAVVSIKAIDATVSLDVQAIRSKWSPRQREVSLLDALFAWKRAISIRRPISTRLSVAHTVPPIIKFITLSAIAPTDVIVFRARLSTRNAICNYDAASPPRFASPCERSLHFVLVVHLRKIMDSADLIWFRSFASAAQLVYLVIPII